MSVLKLKEFQVIEKPSDSKTSVKFFGTVTTAALSIIALKRGFFHARNFSYVECLGIPVTVIGKGGDKEADRYSHWITGILNALEYRYLKKLYLHIFHEGVLCEEYTFEYDYCISEEIESILSFDSSKRLTHSERKIVQQECAKLKNSLEKTLKNLVTFLDNSEMTNGCSINLTMEYYDGTPKQYQPMFFEPIIAEEVDEFQGTKPKKIKIGKMESKYHTTTVTGRSVLF